MTEQKLNPLKFASRGVTQLPMSATRSASSSLVLLLCKSRDVKITLVRQRRKPLTNFVAAFARSNFDASH